MPQGLQLKKQEPDSQAERDLIAAIVTAGDDGVKQEYREQALVIAASLRSEYFIDYARREIVGAIIALQSRGEPLGPTTISNELSDRYRNECADELIVCIKTARGDAIASMPRNLDRIKKIYSAITGTLCPEPARQVIDKPKPKASWVWMSDVKPEPIQWLWLNRIPLGKISQFAGDGGLGKSFVSLDIAARITNGSHWPDNDSGYAPKGNVIILNAEDNANDTIRPRLDKLGANSSKIAYLNAIKTGDEERPFSLSIDLGPLEDMAKEIGHVKLIIVDPITSYLSGIKANDSADIRATIDPLKGIAERTGAAILLINHLSKGNGSAIARSLGSISIVSACRTSWTFTKDGNEDERRLILPTKSNVGPDATGMAYRIIDGQVQWEAEPVTGITADEALCREPRRGRDADCLDSAVSWLQSYLLESPAESERIFSDGREAGHSQTTLYRAKKELGVKAEKQSGQFAGKWFWRLPPQIEEHPNLTIPPDNWSTSSECLKNNGSSEVNQMVTDMTNIELSQQSNLPF